MAWSTTRTGANGPIGSRQSLRHSLSCDPKPSKPHSTIPKHKCRAVSVAGLPRRLPAGTSAWLWCSTESSTCCRLGIGSCLALSFALSWDIRRNSFLGFQDVLKGFSFFCSPLTTPSPILLESMPLRSPCKPPLAVAVWGTVSPCRCHATHCGIPNLDARATDGAWGQVMPSPCWLQARLLKVSLIKMMPGADSCGMMVWITQQTGQPRSRQSPTASATSACSRGGIHGTFSAVGYIGHSGGALPARAGGTLSRLAAVFAACCVAAGADSCIYDSRGGRAIAPAGTDGGRGGGVGRR